MTRATRDEAEWLTCTEPHPLLLALIGRASDRKVRLFGVACCRRVAHRYYFAESEAAVAVAERFADGEASDGERAAARQEVAALIAPYYDNYPAWADMAAERVLMTDEASHSRFPSPVWTTFAPAQTPHGHRPELERAEQEAQAGLVRDVFGNPFRPVTFSPAWRTSTVVSLSRQMYESRDFAALPILADALEDAGCEDADLLDHCRGPGSHVRGCWVVDLVLAKG